MASVLLLSLSYSVVFTQPFWSRVLSVFGSEPCKGSPAGNGSGSVSHSLSALPGLGPAAALTPSPVRVTLLVAMLASLLLAPLPGLQTGAHLRLFADVPSVGQTLPLNDRTVVS